MEPIKIKSGRWNGLRMDASQAIKRMLVHLRIVPPPFRISLDITDACNFHCPTCDKWKNPKSQQELSLAAWENVFEKIKGLSLLKEIAISGGEPFVHPHIMDILRLAKKQKLRIVLISNGGALSAAKLKMMNEIGVDHLMLSLNSLSPETHDKSRGKNGNHQHLIALIDAWKKIPGQMQLSLSTIIMQSNCHELAAMAHFAEAKGLSIMFQPVLPVETHFAFSSGRNGIALDEDWYQKNPFWVKRVNVLIEQIEKLLSLQKQGKAILNPPSQLKKFMQYFENPERVAGTPCLGTQNRLFIDPVGDLRLCYGFPPIGNILTDDPHQIWYSAAAKQIRKQSRHCKKPCRLQNCNI